MAPKVISATPGAQTYMFGPKDAWMRKPYVRYWDLETAVDNPEGPYLYVFDGNELVRVLDLTDKIVKGPGFSEFLDYVRSLLKEEGL